MKIIFLIINLFIFLNSSAQVEIFNRSLTDSTLEIIYLGEENVIALKTKIQREKLLVAVKNGFISTNQPYVYRWIVHEIKNSVFKVYDDKGKIISQKNFKVDSVPDPRAKIPSEKDSVSTVSGLLLNPYMQIIL